jgi:hypothetical protein
MVAEQGAAPASEIVGPFVCLLCSGNDVGEIAEALFALRS